MKIPDTKHSDFTLANRREVVVQMRGVSRYFDDSGFIRALTNVTFEVRRGEVFGLLGPGGSGKSTAIRILAGRLAPSEGKAKVFGHSPRRHATRARIGYLPQKPTHARSPFLVEVISFLRDVFRRTNSDSRRRMVPAQTAGKERHGVPKQILIKNPDLVLLDEPFSGLETAGGCEMREFIGLLARQGKTVILTSSSLTCTKDICDRLAVLSRGQIEATGTLQEMLATRDGLRCLGDLLPQATAERVLQVIRQDLATSDSPSRTPLEAPKTNSPGANAEAAPGTPDKYQAAADASLAPLLKVAAPDPGPANELRSAVNHEILATLTKHAGDDSPPRREANPKPPTPADT